MSVFGNLKKFAQGAEAQVNPFDHGQTFQGVMHPQAQQAPVAHGQQAVPAFQGSAPFQSTSQQAQMGVFNAMHHQSGAQPAQGQQIPSSLQNLLAMALHHQSAGNPFMQPQPHHGQPEDAGYVMGQQGPFQLNADIAHFQSPQGMDVQGPVNPGDIPMQNSGHGGMGYTANLQPANVYWQNTDGARRNMYNPQVSDNGFFYGQ